MQVVVKLKSGSYKVRHTSRKKKTQNNIKDKLDLLFITQTHISISVLIKKDSLLNKRIAVL